MNAVSFSDMPRALITGLSGFTGRYLAQALEAKGYEVVGTTHGLAHATDELLNLDLNDRDQVYRVVSAVQPDVVAHLAAVSFVAHGDAEAMYRVNLIGTRHLLEALAGLARKPRAVLLASSANVYGNAPIEVIDESVVPAPANDYAVSKLAMEYMSRLWMDKLPIVIARPFNYTGVGQEPHFLIPKIVSHFQAGKTLIELGNIDVERDFSDVRVVAATYAALLEKSPAGEVFNICSGQAHSLKEILAMMAEIAGYAIEVSINPAFVRANEVKRLQGDAIKISNYFGSVDHVPLQETLRWMFAAGRS